MNVNGLSRDTDIDGSGHTYDQTNGPLEEPPLNRENGSPTHTTNTDMSKETTDAVNSISPGSHDNSLRAELAAAHGTINDLNGIVANLKLKLLQMENEASSGMICYYFPFLISS